MPYVPVPIAPARTLRRRAGAESRAAARVLASAIACALACGLVSCTEDAPLEPIVDDTTPPPVTTPPLDAAPPYDLAACTDCLGRRCVTEHVRCYLQPGCVTIADCATGNNCNQECINKCVFNQVGLGRREYQALTTCEFEASCGACRDVCDRSNLCVLRSPEPSDAAPPPTPVTCGDCARARCADATKKCEPGTPCAAYFACANPCLEPRDKCVADCGAQFAEGKADADAVAACTSTSCKAQCEY
jgi:hypothetical protein